MAIGKRMQSAEKAVGRTSWATGSIGNEPEVTIETLQKGLMVGLIATKRADFETCSPGEMLSTVVDRNRSNHFDFLPVIETTGHIVGLIEIAPFMQGAPTDGQVGAMMRPLSEENFIGADASIIDFVRDADHQKCRLVVSERQISGLVSLSDLQQLPVRAALFGLVTYLEIIMTYVIRKEFKGAKEWLDKLSEGRRRKIEDEIEKAQVGDGLVEPLLFTQFSDKITIIRRSSRLIVGKDNFERELKKVQYLRDHLAHGNDYAASPEAASDACRTVRLIDKWSEEFSQWLQDYH
jgi:hypothetical protein